MTQRRPPPGLPPAGTRLRVHFNLHTHRWSVVALHGPQRGRVIASTDAIVLRNCVFHVSQKGRERVVAKRSRDVHAWVIGCLETSVPPVAAGAVQVSYNPFRAATFQRYTPAFAPIHAAAMVWFTKHRTAFALPNRPEPS
jgi:hypothetical protein